MTRTILTLTSVVILCSLACSCAHLHSFKKSDEDQIATAVADFCQQREGIYFEVLAAQMAEAQKMGIDFTKIVRVDVGKEAGDALAFVMDPETEKQPLWYYLEKKEGRWVVLFWEDWPASSIEKLLEKCRNNATAMRKSKEG
jgi:hypothetical protein